jgi:hypothetical protein
MKLNIHFILLGVILIIFAIFLKMFHLVNTNETFMNYIWRPMRPWGYRRQYYPWRPWWWWRQRPSYVVYMEGFEAKQSSQSDITKHVDTAVEDPILDYPPNSPSPTNLHPIKKPYHLLDTMKDAPLPEHVSNMTAEACYTTDFKKNLELVGNYRQFTNNYKRGTPEDCSTYLQQFVNAFYR